jgi:acetyl-CoA synthetase
VIGVADDLTGQAVNAFVALKPDCAVDDGELVQHVRGSIGAFAAPRVIFVVEDLPKTRSGKIMRRILRKIVSGEEDSLGDTSTVGLFPHT